MTSKRNIREKDVNDDEVQDPVEDVAHRRSRDELNLDSSFDRLQNLMTKYLNLIHYVWENCNTLKVHGKILSRLVRI